jgi:hypothetical protein
LNIKVDIFKMILKFTLFSCKLCLLELIGHFLPPVTTSIHAKSKIYFYSQNYACNVITCARVKLSVGVKRALNYFEKKVLQLMKKIYYNDFILAEKQQLLNQLYPLP